MGDEPQHIEVSWVPMPPLTPLPTHSRAVDKVSESWGYLVNRLWIARRVKTRGHGQNGVFCGFWRQSKVIGSIIFVLDSGGLIHYIPLERG